MALTERGEYVNSSTFLTARGRPALVVCSGGRRLLDNARMVFGLTAGPVLVLFTSEAIMTATITDETLRTSGG